MRSAFTLLLTLLIVVCVSAQQRQDFHLRNVPGQLESVLLTHPDSVVRHDLGSLTPPGIVKLTAIIAHDPVANGLVKGLEVHMEGYDALNGRNDNDTVYIDESALKDLEWRLRDAVKTEKRIEANTLPGAVKSERPGMVALAANAPNGKSNGRDYFVAVSFGEYWTGDRFGVYVMSPTSQPDSALHPGTQFRMPKADLGELVELIHEGRTWLEKNPPTNAATNSLNRGAN